MTSAHPQTLYWQAQVGAGDPSYWGSRWQCVLLDAGANSNNQSTERTVGRALSSEVGAEVYAIFPCPLIASRGSSNL